MAKKNTIGEGARTGSVILAVVLAVCLVPALVFISAQNTLFNPDFFTKVILEQNLSGQLPSLVMDMANSSLSATISGEELSDLITMVPTDQLGEFIQMLIPAGWIESQVSTNLHQVIDFLNLRTTVLEFQLDLAPIKANLTGTEGSRLILGLVSTLPECTAEQMNSFLSVLQGGNGAQVFLCNPLMLDQSYLDPLLSIVAARMADNLPDTLRIPSVGGGSAGDLLASPLYQTYRVFRIGIWVTPWIAVFLGLLIVILTMRSPGWMCACLSGAAIFAGGFTSALGASLWFSDGSALKALMPMVGLENFTFATDLAAELCQSLLSGVGRSILIAGSISLIFGLVSWAVSRILTDR